MVGRRNYVKKLYISLTHSVFVIVQLNKKSRKFISDKPHELARCMRSQEVAIIVKLIVADTMHFIVQLYYT